jgi:hypothetical protein
MISEAKRNKLAQITKERHLLTSRKGVLRDKLIVAQVLEKFFAFCTIL